MSATKIKDYVKVSENGAFYAKTSDLLKSKKIEKTMNDLLSSSIITAIKARKAEKSKK